MRILSLLGSPRANGTTHTMARLIAGGLSGGGPVEEIAAGTTDIDKQEK